MSFKPCNRYVLLKEVPEMSEPEKTTILVPDDYKVKSNPYAVYEILEVASDCTKVPCKVGSGNPKVLVNSNMVEDVTVHGETLCLVLENHIYGLFDV